MACKDRETYFLEKAQQYEPILYKKSIRTVTFGEPVRDDSQWFQYRFVEKEAPKHVQYGDSFYIDFGNHYVGHLSFEMRMVGQFPDAPVKVHLKFAENLHELMSDYDTYKGTLPGSWLQQETIYIDEPSVIKLPRRYAFRYLKFTVDESSYFRSPVEFCNFELTATTSADFTSFKELDSTPEIMAIDRVSCHTLENCMQRVFEDGPKRDRRLWLGDLRIQALTGYYTFPSENTMAVIKKCLYLFAAYTKPNGRTPQCIFQCTNGNYCDGNPLVDYSLLFPVCVCDYYEHTGDTTLVDELFDIADEQLRIGWEDSKDGIVNTREGWWTFIDWCSGLKKNTSLQGVFLYAINKMIDLCKKTGREEKAEEYLQHKEIFRKAAIDKLYDKESGYFLNSYDEHQLSIHSQVWMILGGVIEGTDAKDVMQRILKETDAKIAVSPYMHHYVVEAMLVSGMKQEALAYIQSYWGEMVELGADTFWEVFVPGDFEASPCKNPVMNSYCHAWSCSASYFIRRYFS
jgi:hypothetical protein